VWPLRGVDAHAVREVQAKKKFLNPMAFRVSNHHLELDYCSANLAKGPYLILWAGWRPVLGKVTQWYS